MTTVWIKPAKLQINLMTASLLALWAGLAFSTALVEIAFVLALFFFLVWKRKKKDYRIRLDPQIKLFLGFWFVAAVFSAVLSDFPSESFRGLLKMLQHVAIFWMAAEFFAEAGRRPVLETVFLLFYGVLVADGCYQYFAGTDLLRGYMAEIMDSRPRVSASFKSYGLFASYLISTAPFLFALALHKTKGKKGPALWISWILFFLACTLLFLTRSRGAVLAFGAGLFLMLIYLRKWKWLGAGIIVCTVLVTFVPKRMMIHLDQHGAEQSVVERQVLWDRALQVIKARPVFGTGINTYAKAHTKYDMTQNWRVRNYYAHNGYLQMAAEIGLPGLLCFVLFLLRLFAIHFRKNPQEPESARILRLGLFAGALNFLLFAMVDTVMHNAPSVMAFWYLAGLSLAYSKYP
ncbi:MAG: O-antigen ligase family protein [Candidatus Omnitrophica bacterium]|nr:O-antigen ligase family protein [Candidatus Omnitrophota bacterium]